mgnify:CR=1 FL=1
MEDYIDLDKYDENIEFNRDTIFNWEKRFKRQLNELQGEKLDELKRELALKKMFIFDALVIFKDKGKYGVKSRGFDKVIIPAEYDSIKPCDPKYFIVEQNGKYGLIHTGYFDYKIVYPIVCDSITYAQHYMQKIQVNGKYGLFKLDEDLRILVEPIYDSIELLGEDEFYLLKKDNKMGIYHNGVVILPEYDEIKLPDVFGWVYVKKNNQWGYIGINKEFTTNVNEAFLYYPFNLISEKYE